MITENPPIAVTESIFPSPKYPAIVLYRIPLDILKRSETPNAIRRNKLETIHSFLRHEDERAFGFKSNPPSRDRMKKILLATHMEVFSRVPPDDPNALRKRNVFLFAPPPEDEGKDSIVVRRRQIHDRIVLPYDAELQKEYIPVDSQRFILPLSRNGLHLLAKTTGVELGYDGHREYSPRRPHSFAEGHAETDHHSISREATCRNGRERERFRRPHFRPQPQNGHRGVRAG